MVAPSSSRIAGFYRLPLEERRTLVKKACKLDEEAVEALKGCAKLTQEIADKMIENVVGVFCLPVGLGLNFVIDGRELIVPMVVEEPSIVAAVSNTANLVRDCGGFTCEVDPPLMIAQVQLVDVPDTERALRAIEEARDHLMRRGDELASEMVRVGGGMRDIEARVLPDLGDGGGPMIVVHLVVDCRDAMGANTVNTIAEGLAPDLEVLSGGRVVLRILSNLADRRMARASCRIPLDRLARNGDPGAKVAEDVIWAWRLAARDPYRAATHNKGIMNGIDAVAIATGNDWRAVEAGAHAYAARDGHYTSLTRFEIREGALHASIELPMPVATVGGSTQAHPTVRACREILDVQDASELAKVMAAVGLAQNLGALRALATEGIQRGHMALHARQVALAAGASSEQVDGVARELVARKEISVELARELLRSAPADR